MNYSDIIDALVPTDKELQDKDFIALYKKALEYLNIIGLSRHKAMFFGSMQIGVDMCNWKDFEEFQMKWWTVCIYVLGDLFDKLKTNTQELNEVSLSILYTMLGLRMNQVEYSDSEIQKLLEENDKFVKDDELKEEFSKEEEDVNSN